MENDQVEKDQQKLKLLITYLPDWLINEIY